MPRVAILLLVLLAVVAALYVLSTRAREVPTTVIETDVAAANAG